jgi:hypothetical protein
MSVPPYAHHAHLPYAREPWKSIYVFQRLFTTLFMVPYWAIYYSVTPRHYRPRESWSIRQIINVNFTRRIYKITEVAGVTWGTRDPDVEPTPNSLKETRFQWVDPLPESMRSGVIVDGTPFKKVGCYIWPKNAPRVVNDGKNSTRHGVESPEIKTPDSSDSGVDVESNAADTPLIGVFMHGGGYCHMSAHESSRTSRIPRRLIKASQMQRLIHCRSKLCSTGQNPDRSLLCRISPTPARTFPRSDPGCCCSIRPCYQ